MLKHRIFDKFAIYISSPLLPLAYQPSLWTTPNIKMDTVWVWEPFLVFCQIHVNVWLGLWVQFLATIRPLCCLCINMWRKSQFTKEKPKRARRGKRTFFLGKYFSHFVICQNRWLSCYRDPNFVTLREYWHIYSLFRKNVERRIDDSTKP